MHSLLGSLERQRDRELIPPGGLKLLAKAKNLETWPIYNGLFVFEVLKKEKVLRRGRSSHTSLSAPNNKPSTEVRPWGSKTFSSWVNSPADSKAKAPSREEVTGLSPS